MDLDFKTIDLYDLFEVSSDSSLSEIKKAYRKKALIYHPDKNPNNSKANEIFLKLSKALEVLTDKEARASYDKILKAKKEREIKNKQLDAKRRKLKDELESREKFNQEISIRNEEEKLKQEIERIRKEGSKQLEEENSILKEKLNQRNEFSKNYQAKSNRIKVKRKGKFLMTEELITNEFSKFGSINFIIISKNNKSAILEYENYNSLKQIAANCPSNFEFEIISFHKTNDDKEDEQIKEASPSIMENNQDDYEDFVLRRLQEAENNKRKTPL